MKSLFTAVILFSLCFFLANCGPKTQGDVTGENRNAAQPDGSTSNQPKTNTREPSNENEPEQTEAVKTGKHPDFKDFGVSESFTERVAPLKFTAETEEFRTRLTEAAKGKPNFAGHFILAKWGCGTDCVAGGLIDAKTGNTFLIPFTICCTDDVNTEKIEFRADSSLIVFNGLLDEEDSDTVVHYYKFENDKFVAVDSK